MAEKLTATQRKILERRVKTSILMADKTSKKDISSETGVTVRTVNKDIQWVIDNPREIRKAGGKAASKHTVDLYLNGGPVITDKKRPASTQNTRSNKRQSKAHVSDNNAVFDDDGDTTATRTSAPTEPKTNDADDKPLTEDSSYHGETPDPTDGDPADTVSGDRLGNGVITEEIPVTDATSDGVAVSEASATSDGGEGSDSASDSDDAMANADESTMDGLVDGSTGSAGGTMEVDLDDVAGDGDLGLGESSSVMIMGASSENGLISIGASPVKTTKTYTEVVSLDTPDSIDPKVRERLEGSRTLMELPEENDDDAITYHARTKTYTEVVSLDTPDSIDPKVRERLEGSRTLMELPEENDDDAITYHARRLTNLVRDGVMNSDDSVNRESLGHAFKVVLSDVFGHKTPEDGYGDLDEWFQEWDEGISLTDDEMAFQDLSHRMKTEYMKARVREDRVMIVFIGLVAIILVVATLFAIGFNLFG